MLLEINNESFVIIEKWQDMKLDKAIRLHSLCKTEMPKKLEAIYNASTLDDKAKSTTDLIESITNLEYSVDFPTFYGKVISLLSDIPLNVLEKCTAGDRKAIYEKCCYKFVIGVLFEPIDYTFKQIKSFEYMKTVYYLPETKNIQGQPRPFFDRTAIEFTESADLQKYSSELNGGKYEVAANIIAILCRPKNNEGVLEKYNEKTCLDRATEFKNLPMDIVFEVFFCFGKHISLSEMFTDIYLQGEQLKAEENFINQHSKIMDGMRQ